MGELKIFENPEFGKVRVVDQNGEPWFVASDIAKALGYERPNDAVNAHCKKMNKFSYGNSPQGAMPYNIIPESDVYRLVMRSNLPSAERFQDWVCEEVLPSIRKTGGYGNSSNASLSPIADDFKALCEAASFLFDKNQAAICANNAIRNTYGKDLLALMGCSALESEVSERHFTPTELGAPLKLSGRAINILLKNNGLQESVSKKWVPTKKGEAYSRMYDTGKTCGGASVQQLKWSKEVMRLLGLK